MGFVDLYLVKIASKYDVLAQTIFSLGKGLENWAKATETFYLILEKVQAYFQRNLATKICYLIQTKDNNC